MRPSVGTFPTPSFNQKQETVSEKVCLMRKEFKEIASFRKPNCSITSYIISVWSRVSPLGTLLGFIYFHLHKSKGVCSKHLKESTPTHNDMSSVPEVSRGREPGPGRMSYLLLVQFTLSYTVMLLCILWLWLLWCQSSPLDSLQWGIQRVKWRMFRQ